MEFLITDFWNYLHFLLLIGIIILILKDRKKLKKQRENRTDNSVWFRIKK